MVNWKDPHTLATEAVDFNNVVHVFFGLYVWEIISTFDFEISIIKGKRKFCWPLSAFFFSVEGFPLFVYCLHKVPFFLCRYGMVWALIGLVVSLNVSSEVNCGALYTFISVAGNTTIASASTSLMIRTIALWEWDRWVTLTIGILSLGQWGILIRGMNIVKAIWDPSSNACIIDSTNHLLLNLNYFSTMAFDFVILILTTIILGRFSRQNSGLSGLLFRDGLIYFLVTSMCNTIPAVLNLLNFNDEMNVPAAATSAIAACRAVIRLKEYGERPDRYSMPTFNIISTIASRYKKPSVPQTHRRTEAVTFDELGTGDSVPEPSTPKLPTYVKWTREEGGVYSVESVIKKVSESEPMPLKHDSYPSVV